MFALLVAEKALQQYRGTNFERPLVSAFKKMAASLPDTVSLNLADWERTISFRTSAEPILNLETFDILSKATAQRQQLQLTYRKPGRRETELRVIDPYHLANINGEWFLFAWCHLRKDIRTFVPARIQAIDRTGQTFARPQKFSLDKRLRDSFGVQSGHGSFDVVIRFNELVADYIREKKWHESQELKELKDGGLELRMKLSSLAEVERWVLGWGGNAQVIQPPELAEKVRQSSPGHFGKAEVSRMRSRAFRIHRLVTFGSGGAQKRIKTRPGMGGSELALPRFVVLTGKKEPGKVSQLRLLVRGESFANLNYFLSGTAHITLIAENQKKLKRVPSPARF